MAYMDIWMYNSRPRVKVLLCYFLILVVIFVFSDIMVYLYTKSLYQPMTSYEIISQTPEITVSSTSASAMSGNVKGTVKNSTDEKMINQYLKFEFYTPREVSVGTKYFQLNNLEPNQEQTYEVGFKYANVTSVKVSIVDREETKEVAQGEIEEEPIYGPSGIIGGVMSGKLFQK